METQKSMITENQKQEYLETNQIGGKKSFFLF